MSELCSNWNDVTSSADLHFTCCPTVQPCTQSILTPFYCLADKSEIFRSMWKNKLSHSLTPHFTQMDIVELVWIPTVTDCLTLISKLRSGRILLSEVKKVFRQQKIGQELPLSCGCTVILFFSERLFIHFLARKSHRIIRIF